MTRKLMISDLLYDADIVISEINNGRTEYFEAVLDSPVEDQDGIVVTVVLSKGKRLSLKQVMRDER